MSASIRDLVGGLGCGGRSVHHVAIAEAEHPGVPWTGDLVVVDTALVERSAGVGAYVSDGEDPRAPAEHEDRTGAQASCDGLTFWKLGLVEDGGPLLQVLLAGVPVHVGAPL